MMYEDSKFGNPNTDWFNNTGMWITYILIIAVLHIVLLAVPFLTIPTAWTLTVTIHNVVMFVLLHVKKGTPWYVHDQGKARSLTCWEQLDNETQFTSSRKFLTIVPVVMFFLASYYTRYDAMHFLVNFVTLIVVVIPKLESFHKVRLFGINKY